MFSLRMSSSSTPAAAAASSDALLAHLEVLHERVEVLAEDLAGLDEGHLRRDGAVGPDLHGQLVVVGPLADAGVLDLVADALHGAE
jgi:hypothetical protein